MKKITILMLLFLSITLQGQNKLLSEIRENYSEGNWFPAYGTNYDYDNNNNLISETSLNWNSELNKWVNSYKTVYTYNSNNRVTEELDYDWNEQTNAFEIDYKINYIYTSGNLTEIIYEGLDNGNWVEEEKYEIQYNIDNFPISIIEYESDINSNKYNYIYNSNNILIEEVEQEWKNSQWVNKYKSLYTYNSNNQLILKRSAEWDEFNAIWGQVENSAAYEFDANGNQIKVTELNQYVTEYSYNTTELMSNFAHPFRDKTGFDFFGSNIPHINKVLVKIEGNINSNTNTYYFSNRTTYNYNNAITLSNESFETAKPAVIVYPNPTKDLLSIQIPLNTEVNKIIVTDLTGKVLLQKNENTTTLNVQNFAKGMYFLQVFSNDKRWQIKFLKE